MPLHAEVMLGKLHMDIEVDNDDDDNVITADDIIAFLMLFDGKVEDLDVRFKNVENSHLIYIAILQNFDNLTSCRIETDNLPKGFLFYDSLKINKSLTNLIISAENVISPACSNGLLRKFPNIENIQVEINNMGPEVNAEEVDSCLLMLRKIKKWNIDLRIYDLDHVLLHQRRLRE
jgi:hypothetical protein